MTAVEKLDETIALLAAARAACAGVCEATFAAVEEAMSVAGEAAERLDPSPVYVTLPNGEAVLGHFDREQADRLWTACSHVRVH